MSVALLERKRQLERTDLIVEIEQGRRVEAELFRENTRGLRTLPELFTQRVFIQKANVRAWQHRVDWTRNHPEGDYLHFAGPNPHRFPCQDPYCHRCNEAIKRIFRDCGLLPSGQPDHASLTAEREPELLRVPRYRRDESDK